MGSTLYLSVLLVKVIRILALQSSDSNFAHQVFGAFARDYIINIIVNL